MLESTCEPRPNGLRPSSDARPIGLRTEQAPRIVLRAQFSRIPQCIRDCNIDLVRSSAKQAIPAFLLCFQGSQRLEQSTLSWKSRDRWNVLDRIDDLFAPAPSSRMKGQTLAEEPSPLRFHSLRCALMILTGLNLGPESHRNRDLEEPLPVERRRPRQRQPNCPCSDDNRGQLNDLLPVHATLHGGHTTTIMPLSIHLCAVRYLTDGTCRERLGVVRRRFVPAAPNPPRPQVGHWLF